MTRAERKAEVTTLCNRMAGHARNAAEIIELANCLNFDGKLRKRDREAFHQMVATHARGLTFWARKIAQLK